MILIFEMSWTGTIHAPSNSATAQIVARAFPDQRVRIHADPSHLRELQADTALTELPNVRFVPIAISPLFPGSPANVAWGRFRQEYRTVQAALRTVPRHEGTLVFLLSTTATGPFAAAWAARLSGRRSAVQVGFHGNLNDATGWRPRNPVRRAFDTRAALAARYPVPLRFLVLEDGIRTALAGFMPAAARRADVLQLPVNTAEVPPDDGPDLAAPVRIGFVGLGTAAKGMDTFLSVAARARARWGNRVQFIHVGRVGRDADPADFTPLAYPPATEHLPRAEFQARMATLHYVFLPFRRGYYDLSASGALLDAITWRKPVITTRVPLSEQFFADYGDIGTLCDDEAGLDAAIDDILLNNDAARYARQVQALRGAVRARGVGALAAGYRKTVMSGFPALLDG